MFIPKVQKKMTPLEDIEEDDGKSKLRQAKPP